MTFYSIKPDFGQKNQTLFMKYPTHKFDFFSNFNHKLSILFQTKQAIS